MATRSGGRNIRLRLPTLVTALVAVLVLASCSLLSGESGDTESGGGKLEKSTIKVVTIKALDLAPFHIARAKGFFADEGLNVEFVDVTSGADSVNKLVAGEVDMAFGSYVPYFLLEAKGVLKSKGGVKLVSDSSSASPNSSVLVAPPSSPVKGIRDLAGKKIGITAPGTLTQLLVLSTMKTNNVPTKDVKWVSTPFPAVAQSLKAGNVDTAFATEPFIQDAMKNAGARVIADLAVGPTADMPVTGWAATGDFTEENPKTVAAFQRALQQGAKVASTDRAAVDDVAVKDLKVDRSTAKLATLVNFEAKLDATRIQRVPDLMQEFDVLDKKVSAEKMIVPTAPLP